MSPASSTSSDTSATDSRKTDRSWVEITILSKMSSTLLMVRPTKHSPPHSSRRKRLRMKARSSSQGVGIVVNPLKAAKPLVSVQLVPAGTAVNGSGYLEMTGYHGSLGRVLSGR